MQKPNKTIYQIIKEFINSKYYESDDDQKPIITRQELLKAVKDTGEYAHYSPATIDTIRNQLEKCGYLSKCYKPNTNQQKIIFGMFAIQKPIPDNLTGNQLRKMYNKHFDACK